VRETQIGRPLIQIRQLAGERCFSNEAQGRRAGSLHSSSSMLMRSPLARQRRRPASFIVPCAPVLSEKPPSGPDCVDEIKHDGYRILARKAGDCVRLWSRNGRDWSKEFTGIAEFIRSLPLDELVIDGEACAHDATGRPDFWEVRGAGERACLHMFDLLELDGEQLRRLPLEERKTRLKRLLGRRRRTLLFVDHLEGDGPTVFRHPCALGLEGIVSKRRGSRYQPGRSASWVKIRSRLMIGHEMPRSEAF
jgi:bifunctional non-homologous end joining protein LigD